MGSRRGGSATLTRVTVTLAIIVVGLILMRSSYVSDARRAHARSGQDFTPREVRRVLTFSDELRESSGLAVSSIRPGLFWTHNDSGDGPVLYAFTEAEGVVARVTLDGVRARDWESMDAGICPWDGSTYCLYVADMGDNGGTRSSITLYVIPERDLLTDGALVPYRNLPPVPDSLDPKAGFHGWRSLSLRFPDGSRDAEALAVSPDGRLTIVSKGREGAHNVYDLDPGQVLESLENPGEVVALRAVGTLPLRPRMWIGRMVTGGAIGLEGELVVRTYTEILRYRRAADGWEGVGIPCFIGGVGSGGEALAVLGEHRYLLTREASQGHPATADEVLCPVEVPAAGL